MGLSFEHTDLFLARVTERALVELWGPRLKKCPPGWAMLSDRGFWNTAWFYPNLNRQMMPKFLSGRKQFTAEEVSADRTICKLRYTCEVAFSRVTDTSGLQDVISHLSWLLWCLRLHEPLGPCQRQYQEALDVPWLLSKIVGVWVVAWGWWWGATDGIDGAAVMVFVMVFVRAGVEHDLPLWGFFHGHGIWWRRN